MSSDKQRRANQRNAQLSTGPRTDEGKLNSSKNAIRHGLFAKTLTLTPDEADDFKTLVDGYIKHFRPSDPIEADLVEELAMAKMRQKRVWRLESDLLRLELDRQRESHEKDFPEEGPSGRLALALEWLVDESNGLEYLRRVEGQLRRAWERCLTRLESRRRPDPPESKDPDPEPKKVKNEPNLTLLPQSKERKMVRKRFHNARKNPPATNQPATSAPDCETDEVASLKVLQDLARKMQKSLLDEQNTRATFADYLKLLQLIKETEGNRPRQITVRWVDPPWLTEPREDTPESQET